MLLCPKECLRDPLGHVYILACAKRKFYVGFSRNLAKRIRQHFSGKGAQFTKLFKPKRILAVFPANGERDEFNIWQRWARQYGYRNVGGWNRPLAASFGFTWPDFINHSYRQDVRSPLSPASALSGRARSALSRFRTVR